MLRVMSALVPIVQGPACSRWYKWLQSLKAASRTKHASLETKCPEPGDRRSWGNWLYTLWTHTYWTWQYLLSTNIENEIDRNHSTIQNKLLGSCGLLNLDLIDLEIYVEYLADCQQIIWISLTNMFEPSIILWFMNLFWYDSDRFFLLLHWWLKCNG